MGPVLNMNPWVVLAEVQVYVEAHVAHVKEHAEAHAEVYILKCMLKHMLKRLMKLMLKKCIVHLLLIWKLAYILEWNTLSCMSTFMETTKMNFHLLVRTRACKPFFQ